MTQQELLEIQNAQYPETIWVSPEQLMEAHKDDEFTHTILLQWDITPAIWYYLPAGTYGALPGMCCNGIRYGTDGDYTSLPHIEPLGE